MEITLNLKIRKEAHRKIAYAQDIIMQVLYEALPNTVFHGGTAIWRCYGGNRFSEDIDVYLSSKEVNLFFEKLKQRGFKILKKRIKDNSLYSLLEFDRIEVRFKAVFKKVTGILKEYETIDGNKLTVRTLSADDLLSEKVNACMKRGKVRDLYDVFFLLRYVQPPKKELQAIEKAKIVDPENLKVIILTGLVPNISDIKRYIAQWGK